MIPYGPPPADPSRPEEHYSLLCGMNGSSDKANGAKYERSMMDLFAAAFNTTLPLHSIGVIDLKVQEQEPGTCFAKPVQLKDSVVQKASLYALSCFLCEEQRLHCVYLNKLQPRVWMCYENGQMRKFWQGRLGNPQFLQGAICNTVKALEIGARASMPTRSPNWRNTSTFPRQSSSCACASGVTGTVAMS